MNDPGGADVILIGTIITVVFWLGVGILWIWCSDR